MDQMSTGQVRYICGMVALAILLLVSCAKTGVLSGGPVDKQPPQLREDKSTPNYATNFTDREIVLVFDEFVELKQLDKNLLVSPPMRENPKIIQRGKKITIKIPKDEVLREDATYSISFGEAIVDFTAGNKLEGFKYVFATGDEIDSLSLAGTIVDAYTGEGVDGGYLMLYDIHTDSIVVQERPFYIVKTDEAGNYKLENLRSDTFKVVALEDLNYNYIYDLAAERIGFLDSTIILTDSSDVDYSLKLFDKEVELAVTGHGYRTFGLLSYILNSPADTVGVQIYYPPTLEHTVEREGDSLYVWYTANVDSVSIGIAGDTLTAVVPLRDSVFDKKSLSGYLPQREIATWDTLIYKTDAPIAAIDTSLLAVFEKVVASSLSQVQDSTGAIADTLLGDQSESKSGLILPADKDTAMMEQPAKMDTQLIGLAADSTELSAALVADTAFVQVNISYGFRSMNVAADWQEGTTYTMLLLPGAIADIYGRTHDTLTINFTVLSDEKYGDIKIAIGDMGDSTQYLLELYRDKDLLQSRNLSAPYVDSVFYRRVPVGDYSLKLVKDADSNGRWTSGDYWAKRQPEELKLFKLESLRPGFDLEAEIGWVPTAPPAIMPSDSLMMLDSLQIDTLRQVLPDEQKE